MGVGHDGVVVERQLTGVCNRLPPVAVGSGGDDVGGVAGVSIVVDEVGYQPLERAEASLAFQVISKRYEKGSIILTSNKTFSE